MSITILRDASIKIGGVDLSNHVESVEIDVKYDVQDVSAMGSTFHSKLLGLGDGSMKFNFFQDFAPANVEATLWPLLGSNTPTTIIVKATSATASSSNPSYTMLGLLADYSPLNGKVGDPSMNSVTFENGDQSGIVKAFA